MLLNYIFGIVKSIQDPRVLQIHYYSMHTMFSESLLLVEDMGQTVTAIAFLRTMFPNLG